METQNITDTPSKPLLPNDLYPHLNGLGGWFVFVIIGRFAAILIGITTIFRYASSYSLRDVLGAYYDIVIAYSIIWLILLSAVVLYFIFKRNIIFRKLMLIQIAFDLIFAIVSIFILQSILSSLGLDPGSVDYGETQLVSSFIGACVWIAYLYRSKRVKTTFINAHKYPDAFSPDNLTYYGLSKRG